MTSIQSLPDSYNRNHDNLCGRFNPELERFASSLLGKLQGVHRGYLFYQSCRMRGCQDRHELILGVDPCMWHRAEDVGRFKSVIDFDLSYPTLPAVRLLSMATGIDHLVVDLDIRSDDSGNPLPVVTHHSEYDGSVRGEELAEDFMERLWEAHKMHLVAHHAGYYNREVENSKVDEKGYRQWRSLIPQRKARINSAFRPVKGVGHTDTDFLLVDEDGRSLLIIEEYKSSEREKWINHSLSLSSQSGGGWVVKIRTDRDSRGPLIEELWDTRNGKTNLILDGFPSGTKFKDRIPSNKIRGYDTLECMLLNSDLVVPHLIPAPI